MRNEGSEILVSHYANDLLITIAEGTPVKLVGSIHPCKSSERAIFFSKGFSVPDNISTVRQYYRLSWMKVGIFLSILFVASNCCGFARAQEPESKGYAGSLACMPCHKAEYEKFTAYARKSVSFQSVLRMKKGLDSEEIKDCYWCHTTGYGKPGGFVSAEQTPELKNAGCEVCHGPGKLHAETQDPAHIRRKISIDVCQRCHTDDRIRSFRYRPMLYGGAH